MRFRLICLGFAAAIALALAGCNGSSSNTPAPVFANISGDYTGTWADSTAGTANVTGTLAQHSASAGGSMTNAATGGTFAAQMSLVLSPNNSLSGAIVVNEPNGTTCTFSTTGSYDTSSNAISGTYTAVTNCAGDSGTYSLLQQCYDTVTSVDRRKPMGLIKC